MTNECFFNALHAHHFGNGVQRAGLLANTALAFQVPGDLGNLAILQFDWYL